MELEVKCPHCNCTHTVEVDESDIMIERAEMFLDRD